MKECSKLDVEAGVIFVFPFDGLAEVWVLQELSAALGPSNRFHLRVSPENCRFYTHTTQSIRQIILQREES